MSTSIKGSTPGLFHSTSFHNANPARRASAAETPTSSPIDSIDTLNEKGPLTRKDDDAKSDRSIRSATAPNEKHEEVPLPGPLLSRTDTETDDEPYPEGGLRAWLVVLGSFCGMFCSFGFMNSIGVFQSYLSTHQLSAYSPSTTAWIFGLYVFLAFFCGLQIGPLFDAYGPRLLMLAGSVCMVLSTLLLGLCTAYWHFLLTIGVLAGLGTSLIFTPAIGAVGHFFLRSRGHATGLASTAGSLGGVVFPLALQRLFPRVGFAWSTRVLALVFTLMCSASVLLVRGRLPPRPGASVRPSLRILRQPPFALTTAGVFFMEWGLFVPLAYLSSFLQSSGAVRANSSLPFTALAVLNAGSCLGRYIPGLAADRVGRYNAMIAMLLLCGLTTLALWLPAALLPADSRALIPLALAYAATFGFASGSNISITPVCVGQLCSTSEYGRYYATCYCIVALGTLTGIPIAGALIGVCDGGYLGVVLFTGACYVLSLVCFLGARGCAVGLRWAVY